MWNALDAVDGSVLTWDVEGKLASLTQGSATTTYVHDADGNQLVRRGPGKVTVNLGGGDELTYDTPTPASARAPATAASRAAPRSSARDRPGFSSERRNGLRKRDAFCVTLARGY
ncbi:hypothetical protein ACFP3U_08960 [Kitasatospora misakiensis]|uniref:YD repeat-containing protein n=1 Tax=Kitasatospora misakiensis TaxID=67330 RepID=A0ABW0WXX6_9ACTN